MSEKFIIIDTETTNSLEDPLCYDIGFAVIDVKGKVYEAYSFVVAEIFLNKELMSSAYFAEKIPDYWKEIKKGQRTLTSFFTIKRLMYYCMKEYNITKILAHNARFDYLSLTLTQRYLTKSKYRFFFPYRIEVWDTLKMSREVLGKEKDYENFCYEHDFLTKRMCKQFTAEVIYRYLTNDINFEEKHTGLEDVMIEKEIFIYCIQKKPEINGALWSRL